MAHWDARTEGPPIQSYIIRRVLLLVPTILGVTIFVHIGLRFLPGDVIDQLLAGYGTANPEVREALEERYGLSDSVIEEYVRWLGGALRGDFGDSFISGRPVLETIRGRLPVTLELGLIAMAVSLLIGVPIGVLSAVQQDSWEDYVFRSLAILLLAMPSFWIALLAITYGFAWFGWTPPLRYIPIWEDPVTNLRLMWLPGLILGTQLAGTLMRFTRSTVLEVLRQDYVRTARAKGLHERTVLYRHVLRNASLPVITIVGLRVSIIIGGTVILERIFSLPGMGSYLLSAIELRDYPVVEGVVLISAIVVIVSNLLVDLSYALIDPRIRYS